MSDTKPETAEAVVAFGLGGHSFVWLDADSRIRSDIDAYGEFDVEPPFPWPKTAGVYRMTCTVRLYPTWDEYSGKTWVEPEYSNPTYTPLWPIQKDEEIIEDE